MGLWTVVPERLQSQTCSLYEIPKGMISVIQKPMDTFNELVPKSGLNIAGKLIDENTEESKKKTTQQKTDDGLPKIPVPKIPVQISFG